ncbi:hypothetical protein AN639_00750 [Candidatus Epulonipiscium fishelsonii]|uniref:Uncharacterized protein n=1 Tax=Candidatus Epulonipiscium fishelsonii TaxID=77094 RepID=A0ACC8X7I6_9FIRM|nr:hypothetical protein AN396_12405 [Epulopiscium sp. SCG-B11WGA-EpuloA1]ONI41327.1 hypothetical protein AN639_00750 [Epulopiscium sp. SCG-B05WGA-EpuloA1]
MKKLASVFVMLSMVLGVTGCGNKTEEVAKQEVTQTVVEEPVVEEPVAEEPTPEVATSTKYNKTVKGFRGDIEVETEIADGKIISVNVLKHAETPGIGELATTEIPADIVESQSYTVDGVTGATFTSNAIKEAVRLSLEEAGADLSKYEIQKEEEELTQAETETTDVVIVGAGLSGLMAAYEIYETDPNINFILVEKLDKIGGAILLSGGNIYATSSSVHEEIGVAPSTTQDIAEWFEQSTGEDINDDIVHSVFSKSEETLNMFIEDGLTFKDSTSLSNQYNDKLQQITVDGKGAGMQAFLEKMVAENPIDLRFNTTATELITDGTSVTGIVVENETSTYEIKADVVILATGGFGSSPEMMEQYAPEYADGFMFTNPGAEGDGFTLTEDLNVNKVGYGTMGALAASDRGGLFPTSFLINANGQRFVNEKTTGPYSQRAAAEQPDQIVFALADSSAEDLTPYETAVEKGTAQKYDTIEDMAKGINVDVENLTKEIEAYNLAVANNQSPEFDLPVDKATPLLKAPFYAQEVIIRVNGTFTSIEINEKLQVVNADGEIIDGLVAAGEITIGNIYTKRTPGSGFGISYAGSSGRVAGQTAIEMFKAGEAQENSNETSNDTTKYIQKVKGFGGEMEVETEITDGKIVAVNVLKHAETPGIGEPATTKLPANIIEAQNYNVDGITGATFTSNAIKEAVNLSLKEAGVDLSKYEVQKEEVELTQAETETTDVVIVGAGMSGLLAAYEIYETDPDVNFIVVEKLDKIGGSIGTASGVMYTGNSPMHEATGTAPSTSQDIVEWFEEATGEDYNDDLIHTVFSQSEGTVDMLLDYGAPFVENKLSLTTPYNDKLHYISTEGGGAGLQAFLEEMVAKNPIDLRLNTEATQLITTGDAVTGIIVEDETSTYEIYADTVILATGGFGSNPEMMEQYAPEYVDGFIFTNPGATGDGFTLTEDLDVNKIGYGTMGPIAAPDKRGLIPSSFMINENGQRFVNEKTTGPFSQRAVAEQPQQIAFVIADSSAEDLTAYETAYEKGTAEKYDTIKELAEGINVDLKNLTKEIESYNLAVSNNQSPGFDLPVEKATPILKAPFYVQDVVIRVNGTFTSLEINDKLQVVNADGEVIDGLIATGELTVGNVYMNRTPGSGYGISYAGNSGRAAGQTALEMIED